MFVNSLHFLKMTLVLRFSSRFGGKIVLSELQMDYNRACSCIKSIIFLTNQNFRQSEVVHLLHLVKNLVKSVNHPVGIVLVENQRGFQLQHIVVGTIRLH